MRASFLLCATVASSLLDVAAAPAGEERRAGASCTVTEISSPDFDASPGNKPRFPATRVVGIEFEVDVAHAPEGAQRLEVRLYTPQGHLYQALPASLSAPAVAPRRRRPPRERLRVRLSVPGSPIVTHSLYGRWEARPYMADGSEPCGAARSFWIVAERPGDAPRHAPDRADGR